jgi:putative oxidoreductase
MEIAILLARLFLGLALAGHGAQKLFGWFGGYGIKGTGGFFEGLGFKPGTLFAAGAGLGEFGGGLLTALGLGGPIGPALIVMVMLVALITVHWKSGFFAPKGIELTLMNITGALLLAFVGPGLYSVDAVLGINAAWPESIRWITLAVAVVLALVNVMIRRPAPAPAAQS